MHPKELSNMALVAACAARQNGFKATADAFLALAAACEDEAFEANQLEQEMQAEKLTLRRSSDPETFSCLH